MIGDNMFKKIRNIKNIAIIGGSTFLLFIICSVIFLIVSNIRMNRRIDDIYNLLNQRDLIAEYNYNN